MRRITCVQKAYGGQETPSVHFFLSLNDPTTAVRYRFPTILCDFPYDSDSIGILPSTAEVHGHHKVQGRHARNRCLVTFSRCPRCDTRDTLQTRASVIVVTSSLICRIPRRLLSSEEAYFTPHSRAARPHEHLVVTIVCSVRFVWRREN